MKAKDGQNVSYLLRLWQAQHKGGPLWRASIQDVFTGHRMGFRDLDALFDYLRREETRANTTDPSSKAPE